MKELIFEKNEIVFREGDMGACFYQIQEGTAGIYIHYGEENQRRLSEGKPGSYFGEMAVIEAWPRSATVAAEERLKVLEISAGELNAFFGEEPDRIFSLMKQLGGRIRSLTEEYEEVNQFLREKETARNKKSEGFLSRLFRFREVSQMADRIYGPTAEELIREDGAGKLPGRTLQVHECSKGQIIFREGEPGKYMYAVEQGIVGIYGKYGTPRQQKLAMLGPGSFFGEMGLIEKEVRSATAVVEEDGTLLEYIREEELEELFRSSPTEVDRILNHLSNRLRRLTLDYVRACKRAAAEA